MRRVDAQHPYSRISPPGPCAPRPRVIFDWYTRITPGTESFEWNAHFEIDNESDDGEPCAWYARANKRKNGHTFVACLEAHDFDERVLPPEVPRKRLLALEIDFMGARGRKTEGEAVRCVIGRSSDTPLRDPNDHGVSWSQAFFRLVRNMRDWGYAKIDYFLRAEIKCEAAIVSMQGGDAIRLSDDPAIAELCTDPGTGITGLWFRERKFLLVGWQNATGQQFNMQHFPQATF